MPSRKQRKRRQKERRHEYEYVYVDDEGQEVEVEPAELKRGKERGREDGKQRRATNRSSRPVQPPSWSRVGRRAVIFLPLFFIALSLLNRKQPVLGRLLIATLYTALFVPFMYFMERMKYRAYERRSGQPRAPGARNR